MKNLLALLLLFSFSIISCSQTKIGIIEDNDFKITIDNNILKSQGEEHLKKLKINTTLVSFEILKDYVDGTEQEYYKLLAKNKDENIKIAFVLTLENNTFFSKDAQFFSSSATCTGCTRGCSPRLHADDGELEWYCTKCTVGSGCVKSESSN